MNLNDATRLKEKFEEKTRRGFGYFMKNISMVILLFIFIFILTNPTCISNPKEFFGEFHIDSLWVVFALFCSVAGFYQLSKSVQREDRASGKEQRMEEYEEAIRRNDIEVKKKHADLTMKRLNINHLIDNELKDLIIKLDADRAAILEMHNGTNNFSDLPFVYADMSYEQISNRIGYASDEFKNINLAKLSFVSTHWHDRTWIGTVDEVEKDDPYFAAKLRYVEVNFGSFVILEGIYGPVGILSLFWKDEKNHPSKTKIIAELNHSSQILSALLSSVKD